MNKKENQPIEPGGRILLSLHFYVKVSTNTQEQYLYCPAKGGDIALLNVFNEKGHAECWRCGLRVR